MPQPPASSQTARATPRPRFAASRRQPHQLHAASPSQVQTPVATARKFRLASASRFQFSSSSAHARRHSTNNDLVYRGDDAIEDGSSLSGGDEEAVLVVHESPTATRASKRPRGGRRVEDDIEDVPAGNCDSDGNEVVADSGEILILDLVPDAVPEATENTQKTTAATPVPQGHKAPTRQLTSAARLLSSIKPLKRRRLFVSPGLITSSPPQGGAEDVEGSEANELMDDASSGDENEAPCVEPSAAFAARFQRTKSRQAWQGDDDIVDNENSSDGDGDSDNSHADNEDIRDIVAYGELLECGDSADSDDGRDGHDGRDGMEEDMDDGLADEDEDEDAEYDEDMMLDLTPPRVRQARLMRLQRQQQRQQRQDAPEPIHRLPTFQRARRFMAARRMADDGGEDGDVDNATGDQDDCGDGENAAAFVTPARQRHYDALHAQPPPDFFSPQKKRRPKRKSRGRPSVDGDQLGSPSTATTAAINAPEQYVPGGLAAGLRDWLVQVKSGGGMGASSASGLYVVEERTVAPGLSLATGRRQQKASSVNDVGDGPLVRLLLAGQGRRYTKGDSSRDPDNSNKSAVSIGPPAWEVVLDGEPWIVASDWSIQEE